MTLAIVHTRASLGINAPEVTVEAHLSNGLPSLSIVGLPEMAVKESKDRVRSAILNSHFEFPARRITINLAPADLPKEGGRYDLPIAIGILAASGQIPLDSLADHEFLGELALSGELRSVRGVLPAAQHCHRSGNKLIVPHDNAPEASLIENATILPARHLLEVSAHLHQAKPITPFQQPISPQQSHYSDLSDVMGQTQARRALEIAAAGQHNLLMVGPPGSGKTMLANRLPGILPPLSRTEAIEVITLHSLREPPKGLPHAPTPSFERPYRAPHHTATPAALVGGGSNPKPGEISMAHFGVLFLDELPEFQRKVLEVLREPLENGEIILSRANHRVCYPARFQKNVRLL